MPAQFPNATPLRSVHRFITTHDASGQAVFEPTAAIPESPPAKVIENGDKFILGYATNTTPADFSSDLPTYAAYLENNPGVMIPGGTVLRFVDMRPGGESPMHRTVSLDYGVVIEGEIELELDSGEKRLMKRGDCSVQRGTNHMWRNKSQTEWARMMYVLVEAKPIVIEGKGELGEDYGVGMANVKPSGH
ncbi:cupin domain protein [Coniochaeta sp. 2T2.1]|nr:cupin domain protein [Coniochaeta sp. 2T2.1]